MRPEIEDVAERLKGQVEFFSVDAEDKNLRGILLKKMLIFILSILPRW